MRGADKIIRKKAAVRKELESLQRQEKKLEKAADSGKGFRLSGRLEEKIPDKVQETLVKAFCKAFGIVFDKGSRFIEKGFRKESMQEDFEIRNYAAQLRGTRRELRKMQKGAELAGMRDIALTTAEGIGLGALGIGLPDIVLFTGMLLKGVYETALRYGSDYDSPEERMLILKMLEAAVSRDGEWKRLNTETDRLLEQDGKAVYTDEDIKVQTEQTARAFAEDMLLLKFIQGIPLVGIAGGMGNPVYYHKVMKYVGLKYRKRYLRGLEQRLSEDDRVLSPES